MSWQTADLLSADTTDVLAADPTDVLLADTTHVSPADKFGVGNPTFTNYFSGVGPTPGMLGVGSPFSEKMLQNHSVLHGLRAGVVHESRSTGSTGNGPQLAVRTLGYSRLRPG